MSRIFDCLEFQWILSRSEGETRRGIFERKVRAETFNTKEGRDLIKRSYIETGMMKDDKGVYWNATKIDAGKRSRAEAVLKTKEGKKKVKRAKTKGKMADFDDMISNFIEFK